MKTVWKYHLDLAGSQNNNEMPINAKLIYVGKDGAGDNCAWLEVDPKAPLQDFTFEIFGTGHEIPDNAEYMTTIVDAPFIWHIYRVPKRN